MSPGLPTVGAGRGAGRLLAILYLASSPASAFRFSRDGEHLEKRKISRTLLRWGQAEEMLGSGEV